MSSAALPLVPEDTVAEDSEDVVARLVGDVLARRASREILLPLLQEENAVYRGKGSSATVRMRGWVIAAFESVGLPDEGLAFVLEELESGQDAYLIAAAARALRGSGSPSPAVAPFLLHAVQNLLYGDDVVSFESYGAYASSSDSPTALAEVFETIGWMGAHARAVAGDLGDLDASADTPLSPAAKAALGRSLARIKGSDPVDEPACCRTPAALGVLREWLAGSRARSAAVEDVELEDQDGRAVRFGDLFRGRPSVVAFFYTRCGNPQKCSTTIARLARLQRRIASAGLAERVRTAAISYDPAFDRPDRLHTYGAARSYRMDANNRLLRATRGADVVRRFFGLGVSFIDTLVTRHRIELFLLDSEARIAASFTRLQWEEEAVLERVCVLLVEETLPAVRPIENPRPRSQGFARKGARALAGVLPSLLPSAAAALLPKCAFCWSFYLSAFGIAGLENVPYEPWLIPSFAALIAVFVASMWLRTRREGEVRGFYVPALGALAILALGMSAAHAAVAGLVLSVVGSVRRGRLGPALRLTFRREETSRFA